MKKRFPLEHDMIAFTLDVMRERKKKSGLTPRAADECLTGGPHHFILIGLSHDLQKMVQCDKCGIRR
jgi:hypothetical protein